MARPAPHDVGGDWVPGTVRFPVELVPPEGFDPARVETWPRIDGRLEWVEGRLLYMPPCGERQAMTVVDVVAALLPWARAHPEFSLSTNEPGMVLGADTRGADVGIWRRTGGVAAGFVRIPPVLAVEVAGRDEGERELRVKARWYRDAGVPVVWIVLPAEREVIVVSADAERRLRCGERLPADPSLPGLAPVVDELFVQVSRA